MKQNFVASPKYAKKQVLSGLTKKAIKKEKVDDLNGDQIALNDQEIVQADRKPETPMKFGKSQNEFFKSYGRQIE